MLKHHFITALRRMVRNRSITLINIFGITLGMAVAFVVLIYVYHEMSHDRFLKDRELIYRLSTEKKAHGWKTAMVPYPLASTLVEEYPGVRDATTMGLLHGIRVKKGKTFIGEDGFFCADSSFFDVYTVEVLRGNPRKWLRAPDEVILTRSMAKKYFGGTDVLDQQLPVKFGDKEHILNISGVIDDLPSTSSLQLSFLGSLDFYIQEFPQMALSTGKRKLTSELLKSTWDAELFLSYIKVEEDFKPEAFAAELRDLEKRVLVDPEETLYHLQSMPEVYFHSTQFLSGFTRRGDLKQVYIYSIVALLIIMVACINYILLSSSQALDRTREVGIRKMTGASRKALFQQVLVESLLISLIALPLALILIEQLRPLLEGFLGREFMYYEALGWPVAAGFLLVLFLLSYLPASFVVRYYSRITPVTVFNSKAQHPLSGGRVRRGLMIVQFGVFLTLISCSLGIYQQIHFSRHHDLGFEPRGVIHFSIGSRTDKEATFHALKNELLQIPGIDEVGGSVWLFPTSNVWSMDVSTPGGPESSVSLNAFYVDSDLPDVMGLDLIEGEPFSSYSSENENLVLINETARRRLGFDDPMGQELGGYRIIGVIRDFHYNSFRQKIPPMMLIRGTHNIQQMLVKLPEEADNRKMISAIEAKYQKVVGPERMEYGYLIDRFDQIYRAERKLAVLLAVLSGIAIFIASMGLLGLTIFQTRKKTREIAIRKINGARIRHVMVLLSGNFVKLILIAALVATPLSYWILQRWLREFAYQTSLSWVLFAVAVALALVITLVTVSYQTWRAAIANPAESLRHE